MKVQELRKRLNESDFWTADSWGHYKTPGKEHRIKIQKISIRLERRLSDGRWIPKVSDYVKNLQFGTGSKGQDVLIIKGRKINL